MDYNLQKNQNVEQTLEKVLINRIFVRCGSFIALFQFETHCVLN